MSLAFSILTIACWAAAIALLFRSRFLAPVAAYFGLMAASFITVDGLQWLPLNSTILIWWLCITLAVMTAAMLQPRNMTADRYGMGYMTGGAATGLAAGLLAYTFTDDLTALNAAMVLCTALGAAFGFLLYAGTPAGRAFKPGGGLFWRHLLAKGFPTAVTMMMIGVPLVLLIAIYRI